MSIDTNSATNSDASVTALADNPLLDFSGLPRFDAIRPEHVGPAIDALLAQNRALIARLESPDTPATWDSFVEPLDDGTEQLARAWGVVGHLNGVVDTPELRSVYNDNQPKLTEFWTELGQNLALFEKTRLCAPVPNTPRCHPRANASSTMPCATSG